MSQSENHKKHKEPFEAPEGYFEQLEDRLVARIAKEEKEAQEPVGSAFPWSYLSIAASVLLLAVAGWYFQSEKQPGPEESYGLADVSDEAIIEYLINSDLTTEEILAYAGKDISFDQGDQEVLPELELDDQNIEELMNTYDLNDL